MSCNTPLHADTPRFQTAALTDEQGKFQFSRKKSDFKEAGDFGLFQFAEIFAFKDGYGFAVASALFCETTGRLDAELTAEQRDELPDEKPADANVLKLSADNPQVHGRIVNTEGQPVAGALDGTLAAIWLADVLITAAGSAYTSNNRPRYFPAKPAPMY